MPTNDRQQTVQRFADELSALRESVGSPSFRKMAETSGCISHTTLHEAASGNRFPSWDTTKQFVLACGADPAPWQERWHAAARQVDPSTEPATPSTSPVASEPVATSAASAGAPPADDTTGAAVSGDRPRHRWWEPTWVPVAIVLVAAIAVAGLFLALSRRSSSASPSTTSSTAAPQVAAGQTDPGQSGGSSSGCVVSKAAASPMSPVTPGDSSTFGADISYPDCATVKVGQKFTKEWRLDNVGSVTWTGRSLSRMGPPQGATDCRTPKRAVVPSTAPGHSAVVSIAVTAPSTARTCYVKFEMLDAQGRRTFPGNRPVYFYVYVVN
ncbi:NBR1-Ig-like domain-containing protein [Allobranchiibius sp. GilTou73]|uniref:NBR1-Ig-like domain-containing protein n=1 Tax=Allobranchiibius sp. GilTou73 TaxID=2904523 RepID=UPI001EEBBB9B|nr:NBR1-Ig-like domain-containing protein [Allobranchiibius sp. GilTou73]UIJ34462.1 hypothetical protein LVQ62_15325 [Allobranchiibius sp. GilTou73]